MRKYRCMKPRIRPAAFATAFLTAAFFATLTFAPLFLPGCSTSAVRVTYNTLYSLETTTTAAYDAFLDQVVSGKIAKEKVPQVAKAYNDFQAAMGVAIAAAQFNWTAPAPADVTALATAVLNAIAVAKGGF